MTSKEAARMAKEEKVVVPFELPVGAAILMKIMGEHHRDGAKVCGPCDLDVTTTALTDLVFTFETCDCGMPEYAHLIEQLWHRDCFRHPNLAAEGKPA